MSLEETQIQDSQIIIQDHNDKTEINDNQEVYLDSIDDETNHFDELIQKLDHIEHVNENVIHEEEKIKPKRGIPKTILEGQRKYQEAMEKQKRMIEGKKKQNVNGKKQIPTKEAITKQDLIGMKRVVVAGKIKYIPVQPKEVISEPNHEKEEMYSEKQLQERQQHISTIAKQLSDSHENTIKKLPIGIQQKMEEYSKMQEDTECTKPVAKNINVNEKTSRNVQNNNTKPHFAVGPQKNKIPLKYAKHIESEAKKETIKNVKNFSDLRKIKEMQTLDITTDPSKISIQELRKLNLEKRRRELEEQRKKLEANKKESAVQTILNDEKMSKFSKLIKIRNLSVHSRQHKRVPAKEDMIRVNSVSA